MNNLLSFPAFNVTINDISFVFLTQLSQNVPHPLVITLYPKWAVDDNRRVIAAAARPQHRDQCSRQGRCYHVQYIV
jgi:hypothetical protein